MPSFSLEIGGIGFQIEWEKAVPRYFPLNYGGFPLQKNPRIRLKVHCGAFPDFPKEKLLFELKEHWALHESDGHYLIESFHSKTKKRQFLVHLTRDFSTGDVFVAHEEPWGMLHGLFPSVKPRWPFVQLMRPIGQLLVVHVLAEGEGIVVHGLGIREKEEGKAFIGPSGSGKSTLAKLFLKKGDITILSDEIVIIRREGDSFFLHGSPWPGDTMIVSQESAPLKELFFIRHASQNGLSRLSPKDFPEVLFPQLFLPHWDEKRIRKTLAFCEELFSRIPCYRFGFVKEQSAISFLKERIRPLETDVAPRP